MFEVAPNLWLQSFHAGWLTWLMLGTSFLGYGWFYALVVIGGGFALRLRPLLGVMLALVLSGVCTYAAKDGLRLPRPAQVDARVLDNGHANRGWQVARGGATTFAGLPSAEAIAAQRAARDPDYGFISGHVAAASALCAALWLFLAPRAWWWRAGLVAWPLAMAASRMYLGRHFLGDAVGGMLAGVACAFAARWFWAGQPLRAGWLAALALALCAASLAWPALPRGMSGQLLGLAGVALLFARTGFPSDAAPWPRRLGRVVVAFALYVLAKVLVTVLGQAAGWPEGHAMAVPLAALATALVLAGGVPVSLRLGWYRRAPAVA